MRRVHVRRVEVQAVGVVTIVRRRRPMVPAVALTAHTAEVTILATENNICISSITSRTVPSGRQSPALRADRATSYSLIATRVSTGTSRSGIPVIVVTHMSGRICRANMYKTTYSYMV